MLWLKRDKTKRIIIGLTGSFASGKSTVGSIFQALGAKVIDADAIVHELMRPGKLTYKKIVKAFGRGILNPDLSIDRQKLGEIVFGNQELLNKLNRIVHPEVIIKIKQKIRLVPQGLVVLDVPLLVEAGMDKLVDKVIVVKLPLDMQLKRAQKRSGLKKEEILKRIKAQISLSDKIRLADFVIDNSGLKQKTKKQVVQICSEIGLSANRRSAGF